MAQRARTLPVWKWYRGAWTVSVCLDPITWVYRYVRALWRGNIHGAFQVGRVYDINRDECGYGLICGPVSVTRRDGQ